MTIKKEEQNEKEVKKRKQEQRKGRSRGKEDRREEKRTCLAIVSLSIEFRCMHVCARVYLLSLYAQFWLEKFCYPLHIFAQVIGNVISTCCTCQTRRDVAHQLDGWLQLPYTEYVQQRCEVLAAQLALEEAIKSGDRELIQRTLDVCCHAMHTSQDPLALFPRVADSLPWPTLNDVLKSHPVLASYLTFIHRDEMDHAEMNRVLLQEERLQVQKEQLQRMMKECDARIELCAKERQAILERFLNTKKWQHLQQLQQQQQHHPSVPYHPSTSSVSSYDSNCYGGKVAYSYESASAQVSGGGSRPAAPLYPSHIDTPEQFRRMSATLCRNPDAKNDPTYEDQVSAHRIQNAVCWQAYNDAEGNPSLQQNIMKFAHGHENILYSAHNKEHSLREAHLKAGTHTATDMRLKGESMSNSLEKLHTSDPATAAHLIRTMATASAVVGPGLQEYAHTPEAKAAIDAARKVVEAQSPTTVHVSAYTRADGTPVKAHERSLPGSAQKKTAATGTGTPSSSASTVSSYSTPVKPSSSLSSSYSTPSYSGSSGPGSSSGTVSVSVLRLVQSHTNVILLCWCVNGTSLVSFSYAFCMTVLNPGLDSGFKWGFDPGSNPRFDPGFYPRFNPGYKPSLTSKTRQS